MNTYFEQIYYIVSKIPKGKVMTYGQIATLLGNPRNGRIVGWAMRMTPDHLHLPCHRVINREGTLAPGDTFGGKEVQRSMLVEEGVIFKKDGRVDLEKSQWIVE